MAKIYNSLNKDKTAMPKEFLVMLFLFLVVMIVVIQTMKSVIFAILFFGATYIYIARSRKDDPKKINCKLSNNQYKDYYE